MQKKTARRGRKIFPDPLFAYPVGHLRPRFSAIPLRRL